MHKIIQKLARSRTAAGWALAALMLGAGAARAENAGGPYPAMAPLDQYLMADQAAEIAQARAAAPPSISNDAEVMVLGPKGYFTAAKGTNGFVCMVQRAWFSGLNDAEFWNPKERSPICFNPQGVRSVMPLFLERTGWVLAGASKDEIIARTKAEVAAGTFPTPEIGVITYMQAKNGYLNDQAHGPWRPHLMFFLPRTSPEDWGANLPGSPVFGGGDGIQPYILLFVPVARWSDGTPDASSMNMKM
jgi:hypothetical protein